MLGAFPDLVLLLFGSSRMPRTGHTVGTTKSSSLISQEIPRFLARVLTSTTIECSQFASRFRFRRIWFAGVCHTFFRQALHQLALPLFIARFRAKFSSGWSVWQPEHQNFSAFILCLYQMTGAEYYPRSTPVSIII